MDIKQIINLAVEKLLNDEQLKEKFLNDPVSALEKILNIDLPNEMLDPVVEGIKAKLTVDTIQDTLEDATSFLKKLF